MTLRFEVSVNGQRSCIAGLEGPGVLSSTLSFMQAPQRDAQLFLSVGGLGNVGGVKGAHELHVTWEKRPIREGDEIVLRVLPSGPSDPPEMALAPQEEASGALECEDAIFGRVEQRAGIWHSEAPFPNRPFERVVFQMPAGEDGPEVSQRLIWTRFLADWSTLWPKILAKLVRCHPDYEDEGIAEARLDPTLRVFLARGVDRVDLEARFLGESEATSITLEDGEITRFWRED